MPSRVKFFFEAPAYLPRRTAVKKLIESVFRLEGRPLDRLIYVFCTDRQLLEMNRKYLRHDDYTDVITFDLSENEAIAGEVYISADRIRENARTFGVPAGQEILRVMIHGALHLCGYEDKSARGKKRIREREDFHIARFRRQRST